MPLRRLETSVNTHPGTHGSRLGYLPGLDGLRALAIIGVLFYHADLSWMPGGFLGVEAFFVISGYLITSLLLSEWQQQGQIDLKAFWLRRARRLLPALFVVIAAALSFAVLFLPAQVASLRGDALAAVGYVTNWYLILSHKSYFEVVGRPSLFRHLWSLAVEEQFYLLWPLLFTAGMMFLKRRRMWLAVVAGAAGSSILMASLYQPDVDPSRVYYGTDTRAAGLLIGAALAFVLIPDQLERQTGKVKAWLLDAAGLGALAMLVGFYVRLDEFQPFLYRGGLTCVALLTAVLIAAAVHPRARLVPRLLGQRVLCWIGLRSYGIYLWHWPIFMVTRPQLDLPLTGLPLLILRLSATCLIAELSYRYVEIPIRAGALGRAWSALREKRRDTHRRPGVRWAGAAVTVVALSVALSVSVVGAQQPPPPSFLSVEAIHTAGLIVTPAPGAATGDPTVPASAEQQTVTPPVSPLATPTPAGEPVGTPPDQIMRRSRLVQSSAASAESGVTPTLTLTSTTTSKLTVTAIGDSVMLGTAGQLQDVIPGIGIDAAISRQVAKGIGILRQLDSAKRLGQVVVIHLGNNGTFSAAQFDEIMQIVGDKRQVIFLNNKVPPILGRSEQYRAGQRGQAVSQRRAD